MDEDGHHCAKEAVGGALGDGWASASLDFPSSRPLARYRKQHRTGGQGRGGAAAAGEIRRQRVESSSSYSMVQEGGQRRSPRMRGEVRRGAGRGWTPPPVAWNPRGLSPSVASPLPDFCLRGPCEHAVLVDFDQGLFPAMDRFVAEIAPGQVSVIDDDELPRPAAAASAH
jgi:hypothetical protein